MWENNLPPPSPSQTQRITSSKGTIKNPQPRAYFTERRNSEREKQMYQLIYTESRKVVLKEPVYRGEIETQM